MNGSVRDRFRALVPTVSPPAVARFMEQQGWELEKRREGVREIWRYPSEDGLGYRYRLMLPLADDYEDFDERLGDTLIALGRIYDLDPWGLLESLKAPADLISVQLNRNTGDSDITLAQAKSVVNGLYGMLESAATHAWNPSSSGRGPRSKQVTRYLNESVRFSQFAPENFSLMVVSRLNTEQLKPISTTRDEIPFSRRVVRTLMSDLAMMREMALRLRDELPAAPLHHDAPLSMNSAKSLVSMTDSLDLQSIDFSFRLAADYEDTDRLESTFTLHREEIERIPDLERALSTPRGQWETARLSSAPRRKPEIASPLTTEEVTLHGFVHGVFRGPGDAQNRRPGGTMVVSADLEGTKRQIHVPLSDQEYSYAIEAHRRNVAVTVRGRLVRAGNVLELHGEPALDVEELLPSIDLD
ncbi:hypothetical protein [Streptomyces sp. NPDC054804]